jgi:hypothetical protein
MSTQSIVLIAISFTTTTLSKSYCKKEAERGANGRMVQKGHSRETKNLFNHTYIPHQMALMMTRSSCDNPYTTICSGDTT